MKFAILITILSHIGMFSSIAYADLPVQHASPGATATGKAIFMSFADDQCDQLVSASPSVSYSSPLSLKKIDRMIRVFLKGPPAKVERYTRPDGHLQKAYAGFRFEKNSIVVMFSTEAESILNGTACEQTTNRDPLEKMLLQLKDVKEVKFEVGGKLLGDTDA